MVDGSIPSHVIVFVLDGKLASWSSFSYVSKKRKRKRERGKKKDNMLEPYYNKYVLSTKPTTCNRSWRDSKVSYLEPISIESMYGKWVMELC